MIRLGFQRMLRSMQRRYDYDVRYMQDILHTDLRAFLKFMGLQTMSSHRGNLPAGPLFAARIRALLWEDCGPCTQLVVDMALEAGVSPEVVRAIVDRDLAALPEDVALVVRFADLVLAHDPGADTLREQIVKLWGDQGLVALAYGISSSKVYPALKYSLGYGKVCHRIRIDDNLSLAPNRPSALAMGADNG